MTAFRVRKRLRTGGPRLGNRSASALFGGPIARWGRALGHCARCALALPAVHTVHAAPPFVVTWRPVRALAGVVAELRIRFDSEAAPGLSGAVVGEPLHFEQLDDGRTFWALVPVPLDSADSLDVALVVRPADTVVASLPVRARARGMQVLHLRPPYNRPPDSATVSRLLAEKGLLDSIREAAHLVPRLWHAAFLRPVPGRVTTGFGVARKIDGMLEPVHRGIDLAGAKGSAVRAANRGIVALASALYESGLTVVVDHGAGLVTTYGHLSSVRVTVGDTVDRGEVLGRVGASGRVTGPHLHWGAFYGALPVDPLSLLGLEGPPSISRSRRTHEEAVKSF